MRNRDKGADTLTKREAAAIRLMAAWRIAFPNMEEQAVAHGVCRDVDVLFDELEKPQHGSDEGDPD